MAARLAPELPFPPYTYVPGKTPHPKSDPAGHAYGLAGVPPAPVDPGRWWESRAYLHGLDLFNGQFYWEAHEQFEGLWLAVGRQGPVAVFLKSLIKLAAAGVKNLARQPQGVNSHARRATELLRGLAQSSVESTFLGLSLPALLRLAEAVCRDGWPDPPPSLVPGNAG
jgi:hypothetical protein